MRIRLLILLPLVACKASSITLPKPTATTAFIVDTSTDYSVSQLDALNVANDTMSNVLPSSVYPPQSLVRAFAHNLYIVGQDSVGDGNNLLVLSPDSNYAPACGKSITDCQFSLPQMFDAQDFWVTDPNKMYLTAYLTADGPAPGSVSNLLHIYNPLTGAALGTIDLAAGAKALSASDGGEDLLAVVGDGTIDLGAMYQVDNHLFVVAQMLVTGPVGEDGYTTVSPVKTNDACGYAPSRVIVVDLDHDSVVKVIKLSGANSVGPFIVEPGTQNLLLASPGPEDVFDQEPCDGIERIDTSALQSKGLALSETQLSGGVAHNGTVVSFDLDSKGNGLAFTGSGTTDAPDYQLIRFDLKNGFDVQISDAGVKGLTSNGFIVANAAGDAYVSLPYEDTPAIYSYTIATGALINTLPLTERAVGVAFYPGAAFITD